MTSVLSRSLGEVFKTKALLPALDDAGVDCKIIGSDKGKITVEAKWNGVHLGFFVKRGNERMRNVQK